MYTYTMKFITAIIFHKNQPLQHFFLEKLRKYIEINEGIFDR